jgi:hypothetical protein
VKTFTIIDSKGAFAAWDWVRKQVLTGKTIRLTIELESEPISQVRRMTLWRVLDRLSSQVVIESGLVLTARQWHQIACRLALGVDYLTIGEVPHEAAREPKNLSGEAFDAVAGQALALCEYFEVDLTDIENGNDQRDKLDGSL